MGTNFDQAALAGIAARLDEAQRERRQIGQLSALHPELTIGDAYAIQNAWLEMKLAAGRVVKGHKIGLTSRAMQMAIGIDEPDYGFLLDDMFYGDGARIPSERFIEPRVEAELAFVLEAPLSGPECTLFDVLNATDYVVPALEILDARILRSDPQTGRTRTVRWIAALCYRNGQIEESGVAAAVLNHPANGIAWLANRLAPHGVSLKAGEIVLSGSFIRPIDARKGDTFHADYGPYGSVSCQFV